MTSEKTPDAETPTIHKRKVRPAAVIFGLLVLAAGGFGLYEMAQPPGKKTAHTGTCAKSLDTASAIDPLVHGEVAALMPATQPMSLENVAFDDADGRKTTVASFKGKAILLNLWATWCVPCRAEMPALDRLESSLGSKNFAVVPVNIDTVRLDKPKAFLKEIGTSKLPFYSDKSGDILQVLKQSGKVAGLPTTILIGSDGCEIGTMAGPAQWDSPDAKALIERVTKAETGQGGAA